MSKVPRYVNLLISQRDDQSHRLAIFGIGNYLFGRVRSGLVIFLGVGREWLLRSAGRQQPML
jgi:hypothetical protein